MVGVLHSSNLGEQRKKKNRKVSWRQRGKDIHSHFSVVQLAVVLCVVLYIYRKSAYIFTCEMLYIYLEWSRKFCHYPVLPHLCMLIRQSFFKLLYLKLSVVKNHCFFICCDTLKWIIKNEIKKHTVSQFLNLLDLPEVSFLCQIVIKFIKHASVSILITFSCIFIFRSIYIAAGRYSCIVTKQDDRLVLRCHSKSLWHLQLTANTHLALSSSWIRCWFDRW